MDKIIAGTAGALSTIATVGGASVSTLAKFGIKVPCPAKWYFECFPAGTLVGTKSGLRGIETIRPGDFVWAFDLQLRTWRLCLVVGNFEQTYDGLSVFVTVADETIESTFRHPYWVIDGENLAGRPILPHLESILTDSKMPGRWVDAGDLLVGDILLLRDGRQLPIERLGHSSVAKNVYNITVDELHCYAVGTCQALVHNVKCGAEASPPTGTTRHIDLTPAKNGSYLIEFESGTKYVGKGGTNRARKSARQRSRINDDPVKSIDHTPTSTDADAFKQEAATLESIGGPKDPGNYNQINSPGKRLL